MASSVAARTPVAVDIVPLRPHAAGSPAPPERGVLGTPLLIGAVTLMALGLRLLVTRGLSMREVVLALDARRSWAAFLPTVRPSGAAPLGALSLWATAHLIGTTPTDLRLPSLVAGTLVVPTLYLAGRATGGPRAGYVAAILGAAAPLAVWSSQAVAGDALGLLLAALSVWTLFRALPTDRPGFWVGWALSAAALAWTEWAGAWLAGVEGAAVVVALVLEHRARRPAPPIPAGGEVSDIPEERDGAGGSSSPPAAVAQNPLVGEPGHPVRARSPIGRLAVLTVTVAALGSATWASAELQATNEPGPGLRSVVGGVVALVWGYHTRGATDVLVGLWPLVLLAVPLAMGRFHRAADRSLAIMVALPLVITVGTALVRGHGRLGATAVEVTLAPGITLLALALGEESARQGWWRRTAGARNATVAAITAVLLVGVALQLSHRSSGDSSAFAHAGARSGDWIVYYPASLAPVVDYYEPGLHRELVGGPAPPAGRIVFVVLPTVGLVPTNLEVGRRIAAVFAGPDVRITELVPE